MYITFIVLCLTGCKKKMFINQEIEEEKQLSKTELERLEQQKKDEEKPTEEDK